MEKNISFPPELLEELYKDAEEEEELFEMNQLQHEADLIKEIDSVMKNTKYEYCPIADKYIPLPIDPSKPYDREGLYDD